MRLLKYAAFLAVPLLAWISINQTGLASWLLVLFAFGVIPLLELLLPADKTNYEPLKSPTALRMMDGLIWLVLPCYGFVLWTFLTHFNLQNNWPTIMGHIASTGMACGILAINVGHELGHRQSHPDRLFGELLLVMAQQAHFLPYHNHGHHRFVATHDDPATARKNETVYHFWIRSQTGSYLAAWRIEKARLLQKGKRWLSLNNRMIRYSLMQAMLLAAIFLSVGLNILLAYLMVCLVGALLLETVNYIEHYGLRRQLIEGDRFERVTPLHSWNSDHLLGRLMLFELSRHSDHHANPRKPYYDLQSYPDSPQMPTGYPGMMLLSLLPPLWFRLMNPKIQ